MKHDNIFIKLFIAVMLVTVIAGWDVAHSGDIITKAEDISASDDGRSFTDNSTQPLELTTQSFKPTFNNEVEEYIYQVFGDTGYKRAMLLLKGNGPDTCAENRGLSPSAVNDNTAWGGVGRDWSIFQVNDVYHPVTELNLHTDWKANVDYAKRMYDNDGQTFGKRWTCGKVYAKEGLDI